MRRVAALGHPGARGGKFAELDPPVAGGDRVVFGANLAGGRSAEVLFEAGVRIGRAGILAADRGLLLIDLGDQLGEVHLGPLDLAALLVDFELVHGFDRIHNDRSVGRFTRRADNFLMVLMADQNDGTVLTRELERLEVNFGHQRTGCVDDLETSLAGLGPHLRRDSMRAEDHSGAGRYFFQLLDKDGS